MLEEKKKSKYIIRKLPPQLTEEEFLKSIQPYIVNIDFWYFVGGKLSQSKLIYSRACVHFNDYEISLRFKEEFNGHIFVDNKGKEHRCTVDVALSQMVPKFDKVKMDDEDESKHINTIQLDTDFQRFLKKLEQPIQYLPSADIQYEERKLKENQEKPVSTPILDEIRKKAVAQSKMKVDKRRKRGIKGKKRDQIYQKETGQVKMHQKNRRKKIQKETMSTLSKTIIINTKKITLENIMQTSSLYQIPLIFKEFISIQ